MTAARARFAAERHQILLRRLRDHGRIDAAGVAGELGVSGESVRKDLALLEDRGLLRRVHGGAVPVHDLRAEPEIAARTSNAAEKRGIARAALRHVPPGGSILLDAGSTTARLAGLLPGDRALFAATNSLPIADTLTAAPAITVQVLGGTVRRPSLAGVGPRTVEALAAVNVDVAFLGANAVSVWRGLTTPDEQEGMTKHAMLATARRRILLADHSKFGRESTFRYAGVGDLDLVITDTGTSAAVVASLLAAGVEVEVVAPTP